MSSKDFSVTDVGILSRKISAPTSLALQIRLKSCNNPSEISIAELAISSNSWPSSILALGLR